MFLALFALPAIAATGTAIVFAVSGSEPAGDVASETPSPIAGPPTIVAGASPGTDKETQAPPPAQIRPSPAILSSVPLLEQDLSHPAGNTDLYIAYIALGDSLAAGVGASSADRGYVDVFRHRLELIEGRSISLLNLAVSGATSAEILEDQLPRALRQIQLLRDDGDPTTRVSTVTLNAGGNDLRGALALRVCLSDLLGEPCLEGLNAIADELRNNLETVLGPLLEGPGEPPVVYLMNLYSLSDERLGPLQQVVDFVTAMLNVAIAEAGNRTGAFVVDVSETFRDRVEDLTNVATADIHPNDAGHRELAIALLQAAAD